MSIDEISRRSYINFIGDDDITTDDTADDSNESFRQGENVNVVDFCPFCFHKLDYDIKTNVMYCAGCPSYKFIKPNNNAPSAIATNATTQDDDEPTMAGAEEGSSSISGSGSAGEEGDCFIASAPTSQDRYRQRMRQQLEPQGVDDELRNMLRRNKGRIIASSEYLPNTDEQPR